MITFYDENCNEHSSTLPLDESRHAVKSLRIRPKEHFRIINGKGLTLHCQASETISEPLEYEVINLENAVRKKPSLHIAISLLKQSDRFEFFVEKAVELGISEITPLLCARTEKSRIREDRLTRIVISALKQSGNPFKPVLNQAIDFDSFINNCREEHRFIGHCEEKEKTNLKDLMLIGDSVFAIGPEGDFTENEIDLALKNKFIPVSFGDNTLRTETAGLTVCAYFQNSI